MQIDWLTVIAQIVNFLVLVWLLHRFLYRPVIEVMARREQRIAGRLVEAEQREQAAGATIQAYEKKRQELEQAREQRLSEAEKAAENRRNALLAEIRKEMDEKRYQWQIQMEQEQRDYLKGLRHASVEAIQQIGRQALAGLADADLEMQIVQVFLQRLESLDEAPRKVLQRTRDPVRVYSAFDLDAPTKGRITRTIREQIGESVAVEYGKSKDLLCGIELKAEGHRIGWTLADYLDRLDERMEKALQTR